MSILQTMNSLQQGISDSSMCVIDCSQTGKI